MMESKRGTNAFHGAAYEYFQSQLFNANTWDNNRHGDPIVKFHDNRFGGGFGGLLLPGKFLGGKTYFYGFYQGRRSPGTAQIQEWTVPPAAMRAGIIKLRDPVSKVVTAYNLNPTPTLDPSVGSNDNDPQIGTMLPTAMCGTATCDPRNRGISPVVSQLWSKYVPIPNDANGGDTLNTQGRRCPFQKGKITGCCVLIMILAKTGGFLVPIGFTTIFFRAPIRLISGGYCPATSSAFPSPFRAIRLFHAML